MRNECVICDTYNKRTVKRMAITLEEANRIIQGALAQAAEFNIQVSAAVCDAGGRFCLLYTSPSPRD